ncbi:MAG TPA: NAD-dependent epimerase/dehydratase family protein [Candidatus Acidoferrales bacterium]|nr:NAD-dependent epimerase/dehydratase family protein [Candidatus Acidoferrales bacterium]
MNTLITGGAGFIGSHIVDAVLAEGHHAAVVDNLATGKTANLNPTARFYQVDIASRDALEEVFAQERPVIVSHHAAQTDVRRSMADPSFDARVNVLGFVNLLELCVKYKTQKVIFASTCAVYPEPRSLPAEEIHLVQPLSAYGVSKYVGEKYMEFYRGVYGLRSTIFRYGNVYGPRQDPKGEAGVVAIFCEQLLTGIQPTLFGDGNKTRDYIHVDDVVSANLLAIQGAGDGEVFNLGWGIEIKDFQVFETVRDALASQAEPRYAPKRPGEMNHIALDSKKAKRLLGWSPRVTFAQGIPLTAAYYKKKFNLKSSESA